MEADMDIYVAVVAAVAVLLILFARARAAEDIRQQTLLLRRIEAKLDLLMKNAGIEFDPYKNVQAEVVDALNRGKKIEAIKWYRSATGVGLKEAKDFIEDLQRRSGRE
jgi:ribosomal protein L7/L12